MQVLLISVDPLLASVVRIVCSHGGLEVTAVDDARNAVKQCERAEFVACLLHLQPGLDDWSRAIEAARALPVPIAVLSEDGSGAMRKLALALGVRDYIDWPCLPEELLSRLSNVAGVRGSGSAARSGNGWGACLDVVPGVQLDMARFLLIRNTETIWLSRYEFGLLRLLMMHPNQTLSREQIITHVWGLNYAGSEREVDTYIAHLRRKIGDDPRVPKHIQTRRGFGYVFVPGESSDLFDERSPARA